MSIFSALGKIAGSIAPILGAIPGIGTIPAAITGGIGGLLQGKGVGGALRGAAGGALGGLGGGALQAALGGSPTGPLSGIASQIGRSLQNPEGNLDLGKLVGVAGTAMNAIGANNQRKSAQNYVNGLTDQRNQLMSRILSGGQAQQYNFAPEGQ